MQTLNSVFNDLFTHTFIFLGEHLFVRLYIGYAYIRIEVYIYI